MGENDHGETPGAATRRTVLRGALVAGVATPLLAACGSSSTQAGGNAPATSAQSSGAGASSASGGGGSDAIAQTSDVPPGGGVILPDAGVVITQPAAGRFNGFSSTCTHRGCPLHDVTKTINCTCHGSQFSIDDGSVVTGPATQPLPKKPIVVAGTDISLA